MSRFATCGLTILLALAPAALAVDGTVLINQSTITNGLPNCPTGGHFPIIICQPGSYRLSGNITVAAANTNAIDIFADNVTIDLNGFSIIGPGSCSGFPTTTSCTAVGEGFGILSFNLFTVVLNGDIQGMGADGIRLSNDSRVENVHATGNGEDGIMVGGNSKVSSCRANNNGRNGITTVGAGSVISGNIANGNAADGISPICISLIESNAALSNGGKNIDPFGVSACVLVNNAAP